MFFRVKSSQQYISALFFRMLPYIYRQYSVAHHPRCSFRRIYLLHCSPASSRSIHIASWHSESLMATYSIYICHPIILMLFQCVDIQVPSQFNQYSRRMPFAYFVTTHHFHRLQSQHYNLKFTVYPKSSTFTIITF